MPTNFTPNNPPVAPNPQINPGMGVGDPAPLSTGGGFFGKVKDFFSKYKWYIVGALGVAGVVTVVGIFSYQWYFKPIAKPVVQNTADQITPNLENTDLSTTTAGVVVLDENGQPVVNTNNTDGVVSGNAGGGVSGGNDGVGAVVPAGGNAGGGAVAGGGQAPAGGGGEVMPPVVIDGGAQPPVGGGINNDVANGNNIPVVGGGVQVPVVDVNVPGVVVPVVPGSDGGAVDPTGVNLPIVAKNVVNIRVDTFAMPANRNGAVMTDNQTIDLLALFISSEGPASKLKKITFTSNAVPVLISMKSDLVLKLKSSGREIGRVSYANLPAMAKNTQEFTFDNLNVDIFANDSDTVILSAVLKSLTQANQDGLELTAVFTSAGFVGADNRSFVYTDSIVGNHTYIYKNYPVLSRVAMGGELVKGENSFLKVKIKPYKAGTIGWRKMGVTFSGKIKGLTIGQNQNDVRQNPHVSSVSNVIFPPYPGLAVGEYNETQLINTLKVYRYSADGTQTAVNGSWAGKTYLGKNVMVFTASAEQQISTETTYVIKGNVLVDIIKNDFVTAKIDKNSTIAVGTKFSEEQSSNRLTSFFWSGLVDPAHNAETSDWHNDRLLPSLPTIEQKLSAPLVLVPVQQLPVINPIKVIPVLP